MSRHRGELAREILEHRMRDSFAGYDWGDPILSWETKHQKMLATSAERSRAQLHAWTGRELIDELAALRDHGMAAWEAARALGLSDLANLEKRCYRAGEPALAQWVHADCMRGAA